VVALVAGGGCVSLDDLTGGVPSATKPPAEPATAAAQAGLSVSPIPPLVAGATAQARVKLAANPAGARVQISNLPSGVTAAALDLAAGKLEGDVVLAAIEDATQGERDVRVRVTGNKLTDAEAPSRLLVRGRPGTLDRTFGDRGIAWGDFGSADQDVFALTLQEDGKLLVAGTGGGTGVVARHETSGRLDGDFGKGGRLGSGIGSEARGVAVFRSGNIAVAAQTSASRPVFALVDARGDALTTIAVPTVLPARALTLGVVPDGTLVAAGGIDFIGGTFFALARIRSTGEVDGDFSTGTVTRRVDGTASGVCAMPDGRILATGSTGTDQREVGVWARFTAAGALDGTFGVGGVAHDDRAPVVSYRACAAMPDGASVHAGYTSLAPQGPRSATIARVRSEGNLDPLFAKEAVWSYGDDAALNGLALQPDGKIVAVGQSRGDKALLLVRLEPNGAHDATFGGDGLFAQSLGDRAKTRGAALVLQRDGRIVVAFQHERGYGLARFWP
jgi:uncharacterized delta-60 repeat protein